MSAAGGVRGAVLLCAKKGEQAVSISGAGADRELVQRATRLLLSVWDERWLEGMCLLHGRVCA